MFVRLLSFNETCIVSKCIPLNNPDVLTISLPIVVIFSLFLNISWGELSTCRPDEQQIVGVDEWMSLDSRAFGRRCFGDLRRNIHYTRTHLRVTSAVHWEKSWYWNCTVHLGGINGSHLDTLRSYLLNNGWGCAESCVRDGPSFTFRLTRLWKVWRSFRSIAIFSAIINDSRISMEPVISGTIPLKLLLDINGQATPTRLAY